MFTFVIDPDNVIFLRLIVTCLNGNKQLKKEIIELRSCFIKKKTQNFTVLPSVFRKVRL